MTNYVIDSWAWIEYLTDSEKARKVESYIQNEENVLYTNAITLAEVISKVQRNHNDAEIAYRVITSLSIIYSGNEVFCKEVGLVHAEQRKKNGKFSLADAFILMTARTLKAKILTADNDFRGMKEALFL